jgi:hypothetical protein
MADFWVNGIVSNRDQQPYLQLSTEKGMIAQLSMGQARQIAMDMLVQCSRCEMDAMLVRWMKEKVEAPEAAVGSALVTFRDYRAELDDEKIEHTHRGEIDENPDTGEIK